MSRSVLQGSQVTAAPKMATHVCGPCGERIEAPEMQLFHFMQLHKKYCTPKKKSAREIAEDKKLAEMEERDAGRVNYSRSSTTYTGRMWRRSFEAFVSLGRRAREAAVEDEPQIDRMISEGGRL